MFHIFKTMALCLLSREKKLALAQFLQLFYEEIQQLDVVEDEPAEQPAPGPAPGPARRRRRLRSCAVKPWLVRRVLHGQTEKLLHELQTWKIIDVYVLMQTHILDKVRPQLTKETTNFGLPLKTGIKLAVTICII